MGLSKSHRIMILLAIDSLFFLLELVVGYTVHSLALVADSFHMLNDVLSLCVGLWAVKVANQTTNSKMYTYGWQRAETLGALVNGVFLVALCLSIFLEAIQRFFEPQEVSQPKLVFIVGCFGLASNILGLFLFHDHGHGGHSHGSKDHVHAAEEGENYAFDEEDGTAAVADEDANIADILPQSAVASWPVSNGDATQRRRTSQAFTKSDEEGSTATETNSQGSMLKNTSSNSSSRRHRRHTSSSRPRYATPEDIHVHPASFRNEIIAASRLEDIESSPATESEDETVTGNELRRPTEGSPLLDNKSRRGSLRNKHSEAGKSQSSGQGHSKHNHRRSKAEDGKSGGHSHGDLNMRGVFLHVMGDALGNVGVIASALFIWLTDYWWRFYSDPLISLIITIIILGSAIPLCRAASRILLQAVPAGLSVDDIKADIEDLPGVVSCHHLHVWQLSDTKLVASLHVQVAFDYNGTDSAQYMGLAKDVRTCLHEYGIHSSTIQPEFCLDTQHEHAREAAQSNGNGSSSPSVRDACLLDCDDACGGGKGCCAPAKSQDHDEDHSH